MISFVQILVYKNKTFQRLKVYKQSKIRFNKFKY